MNFYQHDHGVITIKNFYTGINCENLIDRCNGMTFEESAIQTGSGQEIFKDIRNNDRIFFDDYDLAEDLIEKIRTIVPNTIYDWNLLSLNERFRFYRYKHGHYFKWHRDGSFRRRPTEESKYTFMVYLNSDFEGGETDFRGFSITPETGMACLFPHPVMHQGATITSGVKYVLRTDVMYERTF